jgi:hypothetical protein
LPLDTSWLLVVAGTLPQSIFPLTRINYPEALRDMSGFSVMSAALSHL